MKFLEHLEIGAGEGEGCAHARGGARGAGAVAIVSGTRAPGTQRGRRGRRGPPLVEWGLGLGECEGLRARMVSRASPGPPLPRPPPSGWAYFPASSLGSRSYLCLELSVF